MSQIKLIVIKLLSHLPPTIKDRIIWARKQRVSVEGYKYNKLRFDKYSIYTQKRLSLYQAEGWLILLAHAIEKGLSHTDLRLGFGKADLAELANVLKQWQQQGFDNQNPVYQNAISVLKEYKKLHEQRKYDISYFDRIFVDFIDQINQSQSNLGGVVEVSAKSKRSNKQKNFSDLFNGRTSVREYSEVEIDVKKVEAAIQLAIKAPSICNRQASRVHVVTNPNQIRDALAIQGGLGGYPLPPMLLALTTEVGYFVSPLERNQIFTDGGLFAMALLLGLEYEGLAACSLNAMMTVEKEEKIRAVLGVPDSENLIMFISVGNFRDSVLAPKSFRLEASEIIRR